MLYNKKKIIYHLVDVAVPMDQRVKIIRSEMINKYLALIRKNLKYMRMTEIVVIVGVFRNQRKNWDHPDHSIIKIS